ncbi:MAG: type II toxin-antitoxin system PemK/MazF family toxin [Candidatus Magasanikbacteria bacterium]|nr:type II toxin-antitoxin system PemK/MazF family toxin [Candidatus Magasanikbacteria bacterium]
MIAHFDLDKMYCGKIKRGDIFLAEHEREQVVVVVQDDILNERLGTVLAVPVEPHRAGEPVFKNELLLSAKEINLGRPGVCLTHKLMTVDRRHLTAKKGELAPERLGELLAALDITLGRFRDRG